MTGCFSHDKFQTMGIVRTFGTLLGAALTLALAACGGLAASRPTAAPPASFANANAVNAGGGDHIKLGITPVVGNAGILIGIDHGYFRDLGLNIETVPFPVPAEMAAPLIAGQIDIANADPSSVLFNAAARGAHIRFVADGGRSEFGHSSVVLVIRKDLVDSGRFKDFEDLRGLRLSGVFKGSGLDRNLHEFIAQGNLTASDVDVQYLSFADSLAAMANKTLDGAIEVEPWATIAVKQNIGVAWKHRAEVFGPTQGTVIVFSPNMAANRPDVGTRFVTAYVKALRDYVDAFSTGKDMAGIVGILARNTEVKDPQLYDRMQLPAFDPNGAMNVASMQDIQQWFVDNNYVPVAADLNKVVDATYLDRALARVGRR